MKITLLGSKPPIWRRVLVEPDINFKHLHDLVQNTFDWNDSHLHRFSVGSREMERDISNESKPIDDDLKAPKDKVLYEYDFGDSWDHVIELEKILDKEENKTYPLCTAGRMPAPVEGCGGVWGFYNMLDALKDKNHPEYDHFTEWIGDAASIRRLMSKIFNKDEINRRLHPHRTRVVSSA